MSYNTKKLCKLYNMNHLIWPGLHIKLIVLSPVPNESEVKGHLCLPSTTFDALT